MEGRKGYLEPIRKHAQYCGRRVKRGEFVSAQGLPIHADINGSYNILRKGLPSAFAVGIKGVVSSPGKGPTCTKTGQLALSINVHKSQ